MRLSNLRLWQLVLCVLVIIGGIAGGWIGRGLVHDQLVHERQAEFEERAHESVTVISHRLAGAEESVRALANFLWAHPVMTEAAFQAYAAPVALRNPAIRALDWIPLVPEPQRESFERQQRSAGRPDFEIREFGAGGKLVRAGSRAEYLPVALSEPLLANSANLGFDIASNSLRLEAASRARDEAAP